MPGPATFPTLPPIAAAMWGIDTATIGVESTPPGGERAKVLLAWLAASGARAVTVDATMAGIRPRELDRSARRDLASLLRRSELVFAGVDAFVPPEHLLKADMVDRAVSSILGAIDLAADLAALASGSIVTRMPGSGVPACVGVTLHEKTRADVLHSLADHATGRSVRIANHAWPIPETVPRDVVIGIGLDPATAMASGADPVALAARLGKRVASARLSDVPSSFGAGGGRVVPGDGKLDVMAYLVTLATSEYTGHVVLDLRHLPRPAEAIKLVRQRAITGI